MYSIFNSHNQVIQLCIHMMLFHSQRVSLSVMFDLNQFLVIDAIVVGMDLLREETK